MSVANETGNIEAYKKLRFVELLELLCRVAFHVFKRSPENVQQIPFDNQLELILD